MADSKPFASLSSGLLARKGAAKPAMRPQGFGAFGSSLEDLGWNDMGQAPEVEEHVPSPVSALTPAPHCRTEEAEPPAAPPAVREQQRAIAESFAPEPAVSPAAVTAAADAVEAPKPSPVVRLPRRRKAKPMAARDKTAFTLRLDPERHFKLRLACAVTGQSAQQLVTGALDQFLETLPEVEAMAQRAPAEAGQRSR